MNAPAWNVLRWDWPWLARLVPPPWARLIADGLRQGASVAQVLNGLAAQQRDRGACAPAVRFVPQSELPPGHAYESFIFQTGQVPTRDNLHDLFNGLAWLNFPQAKARLNALQAGEIAAAGVGATRGALRDALTLFDENAALLLGPSPLRQALHARQWRRLFIELRPLWAQAQLVVFGHAAQEKLQQPRKPITVHVYLPQGELPATPAALDTLDAALAADLQPAHLAKKPYAPLPVLGVPGWWAANQNFSFYHDSEVFRPAPRGGGRGAVA